MLLILTGALGCRGNCDLVENELRLKERQLEELKQEIARRECDIHALETELEQYQRQFHKTGTPMISQPLVVKRVTLGRLTGGYDEDPNCPGDEALQVLVEPRDCDDQSVKMPGSVHIEAFEINPQGIKLPLSAWDIPSRELRKKWDTPVFGGPAYRIILPWKTWPSTDRLRVVIHFITHDGQRFEADRDVTIRLPERVRPRTSPHMPHLPEPLGPPAVAPYPGELPRPRLVEPPVPPNSLPPPPTYDVGPAAYRPGASRAVSPGAGLGIPTIIKSRAPSGGR